MSDLRDQLRKAGLVSDKQLRQAKHKERLHATDVGREGIEAERREREERLRAEEEARRKAERERERGRREQETEAAQRLGRLIQSGWIREATSGSRRFHFETKSGRISHLDLSDVAVRRLASGTAAIVESRGFVRGEFCVITDRAAAELRTIEPEMIRLWNEGSGRRQGV